MARKRNFSPISLFSFQDIITSVTGIMILITLMLALEVLQKMENGPDAQSRKLAAAASSAKADMTKRIESNKTMIERMRMELQSATKDLVELSRLDTEHVKRQATDLQEVNDLLNQELKKSSHQREDAAQRAREAYEEKGRRANDPQTLAAMIAAAKEKASQLERMKKSGRLIFSPTEGDSKVPFLVEIDEQLISVAEVGKESPPVSFDAPDNFLAWAEKRSRNREYFVLLVKPGGIKNFIAVQSELLTELGFDVGYDVLPANQTAIDSQKGAGF